jgi:hypothetical protein
MNWFKRKTQEEKIQELESEVDKLNEKWEDIIDSYCKIKDYIFILKGFKHNGSHVCIGFVDKDTPEDYITYDDIDWWYSKHGGRIDFNSSSYQFTKFKSELNRVGLELKLKT